MLTSRLPDLCNASFSRRKGFQERPLQLHFSIYGPSGSLTLRCASKTGIAQRIPLQKAAAAQTEQAVVSLPAAANIAQQEGAGASKDDDEVGDESVTSITLSSGAESLPLLTETDGGASGGALENNLDADEAAAATPSSSSSAAAGNLSLQNGSAAQVASPSREEPPASLPDFSQGPPPLDSGLAPAAPALTPNDTTPATVPQDASVGVGAGLGGDLPPGQLPSHLGPRARRLLISWADKSSSLGWMHHCAAQRMQSYSNALTVLSLVLGLGGGVASLANTDQDRWVTITVGAMNLASAAIVTFKRSFQITELSTSHNIAARQHMAYYRAVAAEMIKRESMVDGAFFHWAENRFNHLNAESPMIPEWVANRFYKLFGTQLKHQPDISAGLGALSVLNPDGMETSLHFADKSWLDTLKRRE